MVVRSKVCEVISCSKLGLAQQCPMKFYWRYLRNIPILKSWKPHAGATVDAGLNYGYKCQAKTGKVEPLSAIEDAARKEFSNNDTEVTYEGYLPDTVFGKCRNILKVFHSEIMPTVDPGIENNTPMVQHKIETFVKKFGTRAVGYMDLVEKDGTIVDNKTSYYKRWSKNSLKSNKQAGLYAHLRAIKTNKIPNVRFDTVSDLKTKTVFNRYIINMNTKYIHNVLKEQMTVLNYIDQASALYEKNGDSSLFYCNTASPLCSKRYCNFAFMCETELGISIKD